MNENPYAASTTTSASAAASAGSGTNIDALDVSDRWKQYFKAIQANGGLQLPLFKSLPKDQRKAAFKQIQPPFASFLLAFVFGLFYYIAKGMWKKGLVLTAIVAFIVIVLGTVLYMIGGEMLAKGVNFVGAAIFGMMAPRDYYAFKVENDTGWLPVRPG